MAKKFTRIRTKDLTLDRCFQDFIEEKTALNKSKHTITNYVQSYNQFVDFHELDPEATLIADIDISFIHSWSTALLEEGVRVSSINHYLRDLRTFFNWCYQEEKIKEPVKIKEVSGQEELPKMYTDEELDILVQQPRVNDSFSEWRSWAVISTILATGLRASSICDLVIGDIDFTHSQISVEKQKNKHAAILPMSSACAAALKQYIKAWLEDEPQEAYLFPNESGEQITVNGMRHAINRYCHHRGIKGHGLHSIRHNFARGMVLGGAGEIKLQRFLQHSTLDMSKHYVDLYAQDLSEGLNEYNPLDVVKRKTTRASKYKKKNLPQ